MFGERNRGNVYNLLKQIASGLFPMIGSGTNVKSMAYIENVAAFILYMVQHGNGYQLYNYVDKPDLTMNELVVTVKKALGKKPSTGIHWPYWLGFLGGFIFDLISKLIGKKLPISSIRVKKFCATTQFDTSIYKKTSFRPHVTLEEGLRRTLKFEFLNKKRNEDILFFSE